MLPLPPMEETPIISFDRFEAGNPGAFVKGGAKYDETEGCVHDDDDDAADVGFGRLVEVNPNEPSVLVRFFCDFPSTSAGCARYSFSLASFESETKTLRQQ